MRLLIASLLILTGGPLEAKEIVKVYGPLRMIGRQIPMIGPDILNTFHFQRSGWIRKFSARLLDENKAPTGDNTPLCHTALRMKKEFQPWAALTIGEGVPEISFPEG